MLGLIEGGEDGLATELSEHFNGFLSLGKVAEELLRLRALNRKFRCYWSFSRKFNFRKGLFHLSIVHTQYFDAR
jgi:hypothetical protein